MKKLFLTIVCLLCLSGISAGQNALSEEPVKQLGEKFKVAIERASKSSVAIFSLDKYGANTCTGTLIKNLPEETVVLTAKHCVDMMAKEIYADNNIVVDYVVDKEKDLALLYLEFPILDKKPVVFSNTDVVRYDFILIYSYPSSKEYVKPGYVIVNGKEDYYAKLEAIPGCSGSGVFNFNGQLVGVLWGSQPPDTAAFVSLPDVKRFLKENNL